MHPPSQRLRRFFGCDADCLPGAHVHERGGNLSPVAELEGTLAQATASDHCDGVGSAAVDFDEGDEPLTIFATRIFDAEFDQAQHRQPHTKDLSCAEVSVSLLSVAEIFVEGFHGSALSRQAFSLTPRGLLSSPAHAVLRVLDD